MSEFANRWKTFWDDKKVPLHTRDNDEYYVPYSNELRLLYDESRLQRVLEIGCGNGALFEHLHFDHAAEYKGVDLSDSMLDQFREKYPNTHLVTAGGHDYEDNTTYDLIFSNGVVQYFDRQMLAEHFQHAATMLAPAGSFVCASIPWRCFRARYATGGFSPNRPGVLIAAFRTMRFMLRDTMGRWFEWREFEELARQHKLVAKFYGSLNYPYRFHVVFRHRDANQSTIAAAA